MSLLTAVPRWAWWAGGLIGCIVALTLEIQRLNEAVPALPSELTFQVSFPHGVAGRSEPLVTAGTYGNADFLVVHYVGDDSLYFAYDYWGRGGPSSPVIHYRPGRSSALTIQMGALSTLDAERQPPQPLVIRWDNQPVLKAQVLSHTRPGAALYFGIDPAGGSTQGRRFSGTLLRPNGRPMPVTAREYVGWRSCLTNGLKRRPWSALAWLLVAGATAFGCAATLSGGAAYFRSRPAMPRRAVWLTGGLAVLAFAWIVTQESFGLKANESLADFFDYQAESLLHGRLDVPPKAIGNEAFVVEGRTYGYFGVTPALLRLPFIWRPSFHGALTRAAMTVYFAFCLLASYRLLQLAAELRGGSPARPSGIASTLFLLAVGLGSSLFFLGSRAYVYHEAILCGAMFALWSGCFALRYLRIGADGSAIAALVCALLAAHARPPAGLFAFVLIGAAALIRTLRQWNDRDAAGHLRRGPLLRGLAVMAALCGLGLASCAAVGYLKFGTFDASPLRYSVQYGPERLARFEGKNFHLSNLRQNFSVYVLRPEYNWNSHFPYFYLGDPESAPLNFPEARFDRIEPTLGLPYAMPALFFLAIVGGGWAYAASPGLRPWLTAVGLAGLPLAGALFCAIYISHRYTADFCAPLIMLAAPAVAAIDAGHRWARAMALGLLTAATALSIFVTFAVAFQFQGVDVWGVAPEVQQRYLHFRQSFDRWLG